MRKKILLAEDSATIQKVFELAFEKTGFSVVSVDNGEEAVRMAAEIAPDLVVVDVTLPGKDGFEVAAEIHGGEHTKDLPVLILSGTLVPLDEEKVEACGAKGVLFKRSRPWNFSKKWKVSPGSARRPPRSRRRRSPLRRRRRHRRTNIGISAMYSTKSRRRSRR